jgi:hypothetical protein
LGVGRSSSCLRKLIVVLQKAHDGTFSIPDDLPPYMNLLFIPNNGVKLLKLNKEVMVLFLQEMDLLFTVRIAHISFWNAMLSDCGTFMLVKLYARQQAEGYYTWCGRFNNRFFCIVFLKILNSLLLTKKDIDKLIKLLPKSSRSIAHLCQLSYNFIILFDLWTIVINDPHCAFGAIGIKGSILDIGYDSFQNNPSLKLQGVTDDDNNTRRFCQGAVKQALPAGSIMITGFGKPKIIYFGSMLVTASLIKQGAIQ